MCWRFWIDSALEIRNAFVEGFASFIYQFEGDPSSFTYQRIFDISDNLYHKRQDEWVSAESDQRGLLGSKSAIKGHNCGE